MKRNLFALAVIAALGGCGIGTEPGNTPAAAQSTEQARQAVTSCWPIPPTPATPATPTDLRTYLRTNPLLFPDTVKSAYTVFVQDPADSRRFLALGYDVASAKNVFFVSGSIATDYGAALANLASAIDNVTQKNYLFLGAGMIGQVKVGPRPGGPGFPHEQWTQAVVQYEINQ